MKQPTTQLIVAILTLAFSTTACSTHTQVSFADQQFDPKIIVVTWLKKNPISITEAALCLFLDFRAPKTTHEYRQAKLDNPLIAILCLSFADFFASDILYNAYNRKSLTFAYLKRFLIATLLKNPVITTQQAIYWLGDATGNDYRTKIRKSLQEYDDFVTNSTQEWGWWRKIPAQVAKSSPLLTAANSVTSALITRYCVTTSYDDCVLNK